MIARRRLLLVALFLAAPQWAAASSGLIAVLPLDTANTEGKLSKSAQSSIEEMLRDTSSDALAAAGWTVLSTENQLQLLLDNGVDPAKCGEQNCQLATAREIKAEKFISGAVQFSDGEFTASIRLIDTASGRILASERVSGRSARELRTAFEAKASAFYAKAGLTRPSGTGGASSSTAPPVVSKNGPRVTGGVVTAAVGTLTILAKPRDLVRLDLVAPDGKGSSSGLPYDNKEAKPGIWRVTASAPGYEENTQEVSVPADDVALVRIELKALGTLNITGTPPGAAVSVSGPGAFHDERGLPWAAEGLKSGAYRVHVSRDGYAPYDKTVEVKSGEVANLSLNLERLNDPTRTYNIVLNRPWAEGERGELHMDGVMVSGNRLGPSEKHPHVILEAGLMVLRVDKERKSREIALFVTRLDRLDGAGTHPILKKDQTLQVVQAKDDSDTKALVDGAPASADVRDALRTIGLLSFSPDDTDEMFGTRKPVVVGAEWPIDQASADAALSTQGTKATLNGSTRLLRRTLVDGVDCLEVQGKSSGTLLELPGLPASKLRNASLSASMKGSYPLDVALPTLVEAQTFDLKADVIKDARSGASEHVEVHFERSMTYKPLPSPELGRGLDASIPPQQ